MILISIEFIKIALPNILTNSGYYFFSMVSLGTPYRNKRIIHDEMTWQNDSRQTQTKIIRQIFCSRGCPVEQFYWTSSRFQGTSNRNSTGHPVEIFIAFLDEISNSKTFEANLQNSSGRPVEYCWTSSRIQWTSNRSSTGRPLDQMIWAIVKNSFGNSVDHL